MTAVAEPAAARTDARGAMLGMLAFGAIWALLEAVVAARLEGRYHLLQVVWCRYAVHLVLLGVLFGWRQPGRLWSTARPGYQLTRSTMMLIMPASFVLSLDIGLPPNTTMSVFWLSPLLIIAFARAMLGERASLLVWSMAAMGAAVVAFLLEPELPASPLPLLAAIAMAASFSAYVVMTRSLSTEHVLANLFYTALGVFLALTPLMPVVWVSPPLHDAAVMVGIGASGLVALFALDRSASLAPVSVTAPLLYLQVVSVAVVELLSGHTLYRRTLASVAVLVALAAYQWMLLERAASTGLRSRPAAFPEDAIR